MNEIKQHIIFKPYRNGVMAIISGALVSSFRVALPKVSETKLLKIIPNIMADYLGTKGDEIHFALLESYDDGHHLVGVCDKSVMQAVQDMARDDAVVVKAVWPDYMTLPVPESGTCILSENDRIIGRNSDGTGFAVSADLFPAFNISQTSEVRASEKRDPEGAGLAMGGYNPQLPIMTYLKHLKRAAVLGLGIFVLWLVSVSLTIQDNNKYRTAYQDAQIKLFKDAFPDVTRIVDVEAQLKALVQAASGQAGESILPVIDKVFGIIQETKGVSLETLRYDVQNTQTILILTVASTDFGVADQLKANFQRAGLKVADKGGRQDGNMVYNDFDLSEVR